MTDSTLNKFLASGTAAERAAFTPVPPTPASGPSPTYIWFEEDTDDTYAWDNAAAAWVLVGASSSGITQLTSDVTAGPGSGSQVATIANDAVTLAKMANVATATVFYRKTAATGDPEVQTLATLKTDLGLTGTNTGDQTITLTGNVTGSGTGSFATTIANGVVTLAMQANMATASVVYRKTAGSGAPEVQTLATLKTDLGLTGTNSGDQTSIVGITGTIAQFNTACTDADFATGGGTVTGTSSGTNTGDQTSIVGITGTIAQFNTACTDADFATGGGTATGTNTGDQTTVSGNAGTATALQNSRNFSIAGSGITAAAVAFNGTANVVLAASVDANHITLARMATVATASVFYRKTAGTGDPEVQTLATLKTDLGLTGTNSGDQTITLTSDVTGSGSGSFATTIATGVVTLAKMANIATDSLIGRDTAASGVPEVIGVTGGIVFSGSGSIQTTAFTGDVTKTLGGTALTIANDAVTFAKMQNAVANSKLVGSGASGAGADYVELTLGTNLSITGTTLNATGGGTTPTGTGFTHITAGVQDAAAKLVDTADVNDAQITLAKMANIATDRLIGRDTAATGVPEALTVGGGIEFTGSGGIQTSAFTSDVTKAAGGTALTIANNAVSFTKFVAAPSVGVVWATGAANYSHNASGGGSANFLRADGTWAVPPGGSGFTPPTGTGFVHMTSGVLDGASKLVDTADVNDAQITLGKLANMATASLYYRKTASSGAPEVNSLATLKTDLGLTGTNSGDQTITLTGNVTGSGTGSFATTIPAGTVTLAMQANMATDRLIGRDTAASGVQEELTVGGGIEFTGSGGIQTSAFTGDVTKTAGGTATTIANDAVTTAKILNDNVTLAKIANAGANSKLLGSGDAGSGADYAEITLGTNLSMAGTTLNATGGGGATPTGTGFRHVTSGVEDAASKLVDTTDINDAQVTLAKLANMATASLYYRKTASSGAPEVNSLATLKTDLGLTGTNSGDQTITLTGDVTGSGTGSFATAIANNAVVDADIRQGAALTVIGRSANSTGNVADIAGTNNTVLRISGSVLGFGAIDLSTAQVTGRLGAANVTQATALSVRGNGTNATADVADIVAGSDGQSLVRSGTTVVFGAVNLGVAAAITGDLPFANLVQGAANTVVANNTTGTADFTTVALAASTLLGRGATGNVVGCTLGATLSFSAAVLSVASVPNALTMNNGGAGAASGSTFNGSAAATISYNTIGAAPLIGSVSAKTANYTLAQTDNGNFITMNGTTLTLNCANLTATTVVVIRNIHASSPVTIALNSCTLFKNGSTSSAAGTLAAGGVVSMMCWGSSVWTATGSGLT